MTLNFSNPSRSYDATRTCIRFWGYDGALEVPFFVEDAAIQRISPETRQSEAGLLNAFDNNRDRILEAARKAYSRERMGSYALTASYF
jgi:hypothetical protein